MTGLIVGRFQIFHLGHKSLIEEALKRCDKVLVFVGSADKKRTLKNPLSYEERSRMITELFGEQLLVAPLNDIGVGDVPAWGDYLLKESKKYVDKLDVIFVGNEDKYQNWLSDDKKGLVKFETLNRKDIPISSSEIRENILNGDGSLFYKYTDEKLHKYLPEIKEILEKSR